MLSAVLRISTSSFFFLSSSACNSASFCILTTSSLDKPEDDWIVMVCSLPVPLSKALTFKIPLASMSNLTSIWGIPRGAGAMPDKVNLPKVLLSAAISLSPCKT